MKSLARASDVAALIARLRSIRPDTPRRWGRMTAHQMVCHLADACRMAMGHKAVSHATGPVQRTVVKWLALYAPLPWPTGILTSPEIDQQCGGTKPGEFDADVNDLVSLIAAISNRTCDADWPEHPIFGPMSHAQWLRWGYLHVDHHLRQFGT